MIYNVTASIVLYKNDREMLKKAFSSFLNSKLSSKLYLIDNSPTQELNDIISDSRVIYIHNPTNPGFGKAHNIAINKVIDTSKYHLILNPDVYFDEGVIEAIIKYMDENTNIGVLMPKVLYPDGRIQYLAKLLPSPLDFIIRRIIPIASVKQIIGKKFELRNSGYDKIIDVPYLSGCFLLFKTDALKKVKGFDEHIFMHMEDIDICRRTINAGYQSVFYPKVYIYHDHTYKSFFDYNTLRVYLRSAIYYFNKWGWVKDKDRKIINKKTLDQLDKL